MCTNNCGGVTVFKGETGVGIVSTVDNNDGTFTITYTDGTTFTTSDLTGPTGATGPAGTIPGSGLNNYVARWTPDDATLGWGVIQDDGTRIGVGVAPTSTGGTYKAYLRTTNDAVGITAEQKTVVGSTVKVAVQGIANGTGGTGENLGFNALGSGSTTQNTGIRAGATSTGAASSLGGFFNASGGVTNHSIQLVDGTETVGGGKFLRDMGDGKANWATLPASGTVWNTVTGVNPIVSIVPNNGYLIKNTTGGVTILNLPTAGVSIGDEIRVMAPNLPTSLSNWEIRGGSADDRIYYSFYNDMAETEQNGVLTPGVSLLLIRFDDTLPAGGYYINYRYQNLTLTCIDDLGTGYAWNIEIKGNKKIG